MRHEDLLSESMARWREPRALKLHLFGRRRRGALLLHVAVISSLEAIV